MHCSSLTRALIPWREENCLLQFMRPTLLGNGDGTFQAFTDYPAGDNPGQVLVGDFNRVRNRRAARKISCPIGHGSLKGAIPVAQQYANGLRCSFLRSLRKVGISGPSTDRVDENRIKPTA